MTDLEIFKWLSALEPECKLQEKKLKKMMKIISEKVKITKTELFLETMTPDKIINQEVSSVYKDYCNWCRENNYKPESNALFGRKLCEVFKVKSILTRSKKDVHRVYRIHV